jgi:hypothetical protein
MLKKLFYILLPVITIDLIFDGEEFIKFPFLINHYVDDLRNATSENAKNQSYLFANVQHND